MSRTLRKAKGRREAGSFAAIPSVILESEEYAKLSAPAVKALLDLFAQFRGSNNGDLTAAWSIMKKRGWRSKDSLYRALRGLLDKGWIIKTRQGGKHKCSLYAVTWKAVDACSGKLDVAPTAIPLNTWKNQNRGPHPGQIGPAVVPFRSAVNAN